MHLLDGFARLRNPILVTLARSAVYAAAFLVFFTSNPAAEQSWPATGARTIASLQQLVDDLRVRLTIETAVSISVVPVNVRAASVTPPRGAGLPYRLDIESRFIEHLSDDELSAVIAHELGHVWVSTHHPYLQTERLANSIAARVVSRDSLERVYTKVWARDGSKGDLLKFLGPHPSDTPQSASRD